MSGQSARIAFLGDMAMVGAFDLKTDADAAKKLDCLKKMLSSYDYVVANLESPLTEKRRTAICKSMHLRSDPTNVRLLKYLGVNAVTLANNHVWDFGAKGLQDTIDTLDQNGIDWYGVNGKTLLKEICGQKIRFSGFCCLSTNGVKLREASSGRGVHLLTRESVMRQLEQDREDGTFSVLSVHWGREHTNYPAIEHVRLAESLTEVKPLLIHAHHPHQIQGIEEKNGSLIAYSLGNAIFDDTVSINGGFRVAMNEENRKSFILGVEIADGSIVSHDIQGFWIGTDGIAGYDMEQDVGTASEGLEKIVDPEAYNRMRKEQFQRVMQEKFGKHDLKWALSRFNYYSIGAKIISKLNHRRYAREKQQWKR
ncbi:MAG: CapA family protein [Clostridia bacterium]|nr:CapA family protein [Clostridia bacterium]